MSSFTAEDVRLVTDTVARFVDETYPFERREQRRRDAPFGAHWPQFAELGWLGMPMPESVGGLGASMSDLTGMLMAFGRGLIEEPYLDGIVTAAEVIRRLGTAEQRDALLPSMASGARRLCLCHREAGSELEQRSVLTRFASTDQGYRIDGHKTMVFAAEWADTWLVSAQQGSELAVFLVPTDSAGIHVQAFPCVDGSRAADIDMRGVELPASARLGGGEMADSWPGLKRGLLYTAAALCSEAAGIAGALCEQTAAYLRMREQFGQALAKFQALQHRFADMVTMQMEIAAAASLAASAAHRGADDDAAEEDIRLAKARVGQLGRKIAEEAVQLHGGIGFTEEFIIGHYLRRMLVIDSRVGDATEHLVWLARRSLA